MHPYSPVRLFKALKWLIFGNTSKRNRVRQELGRHVIKLFGDFYLSDTGQIWLKDKKFKENYKRLSPLSAFSMDRKFTLRELTKSVVNLEGHLAECGAYEGASTYFIAEAESQSKIFVFDAFEGLPPPSAEDSTVTDSVFKWKEGDLQSNENIFLKNTKDFANIILLKGWIPDRFQEVKDLKFKLVHIDLDLYTPTKDSIEFFYPRLSRGGIMVFDDYGFLTCPGAKKALDEFLADKPENPILLTNGQAFFYKH